MTDQRWGHRRIGAAFAVAVTTVGIVAGFLIKYQCFTAGPKESGYHYIHDCYSDISSLYGVRRPQFNPPGNAVPFSAHALAYRDNRFEYPPLTGLFVSGVNVFVRPADKKGFFVANAVGLAIIGIAGAAALGATVRDRRRLLLFAFAPAMLSYAFLSWDLLGLGLLSLGVAAFAVGKDRLSGLLLGLGAAAKIFPAVAVPALLIARRRQGKSWRPLAATAIAGFAIPNLVVYAYAGASGWWFPWSFQSHRGPNLETVWYFLTRHVVGPAVNGKQYGFGSGFAGATQAASMILFVVSAAVLIWLEMRRPSFRPFTTAFGCLILLIVTAKVISPQYMIWLLPFFVVVRMPWHAFVAYAVADVFELGTIYALATAIMHKTPTGGYWLLLEIAVWLRYAALLYVLWWTRRSEDLLPSRRAEPAEALATQQ